MIFKRAYLIVPRLVEQPTWGGDFILNKKGWKDRLAFKDLKIGQSYELFSGSKIRADLDSSAENSFTGELGYVSDPDKNNYDGNPSDLIPLSSLISENPEFILGKNALSRHGREIKILIKFTQAKGNSFQLHVREKDNGKWHYKPECWYFLQKGLVTLGVKPQTSWDNYQKVCKEMEKGLEIISSRLALKNLDYNEAKEQVKKLLLEYNPWDYVNKFPVEKNSLIDLSDGGIHHSWEEDDNLIPEGNIVYELCLNIMDPVSTIRSFDKGKISQDGKLRKLDIDDYFKYIDRSPKANDPKTHLIAVNSEEKESVLIKNKYYRLDKLSFTGKYEGKFTKLEGSYHHLFLNHGQISIRTGDSILALTQGHSCFIPAGLDSYSLEAKLPSEIFKTSVN